MSKQKTDRYRKLFGQVALEEGFITREQLLEALEVQKQRKAGGKSDKLLGQILIELGYLDTQQAQRIIDIVFPAGETQTP